MGGIGSGESQRLAAQGVIGDDDVCHADRSGSVGIFVERADKVGERNTWRFVDIGNVEGVGKGIVGRCSHGVVIHVDVDVVAILGLEVERSAGSAVATRCRRSRNPAASTPSSDNVSVPSASSVITISAIRIALEVSVSSARLPTRLVRATVGASLTSVMVTAID